MGTLVSFLGSSVFGSIIGSVSSWAAHREERLLAAEKYKHEAAMATIQNQQQLALGVQAKEQIVVAGEQAVFKAEADAFTASQVAANQKPTSKAAEIIWSAVRPAITAYLLVIMSILGFQLSKIMGGLEAMPLTEIIALYGFIIHETCALTGLAVAWWFGARGTSKKQSKA